MIDVRNPLIIALALVVAGLGAAVLSKDRTIALKNETIARMGETHAKEREAQAVVLAQAQDRARKADQTIAAAVADERKKANETQAALARQRDDLARRLREHATRAATTDLSGPAAPAQAADAAAGPDRTIVPRTIGDDLVEEAYRADLIRVELQACYASYGAAQAAIESLNRRD